MSENNANETMWNNLIPQATSARIALIVVILLAFSLGGLMFDDGDKTDVSKTDVFEENSQSHSESAAPEQWTCSMHPQIKLPKPGKCPICFMNLIPLESGGDEELEPRQLRMSEAAKQNARIVTTKARRGFAEAEIRMLGKLNFDETRLSYITAWVPGRLDRLFADFTGISVEKGDHLVEMYSPELLATQEELIQAKLAVGALSGGSGILRETAKLTLDAAREKLRLYGLSKKQIAEIERTETPTDHLTINAPIGGVVVHKNAKEGMYVKTGTRIFTIADLSQLWVMFEAYESDLSWLRYGQQVKFTTTSRPGETFSAQIVFINPTLDNLTRTVSVRAIFDNTEDKLKPDMFVSGVVESRINSKGQVVDESLAGKWIGPMHPEIVKDKPGDCDVCGMPLVSAQSLGYASNIETENTALLIPATAPLLTGSRAVVYVELPVSESSSESPLFEGRVVELGPRAGDWYVVKSGIAEGESVVVNGAFKLDAELQIRAKPSMMLPEGGVGSMEHVHGGEAPQSEPTTKISLTATDNQQTMNQTVSEIDDAALSALTPLYRTYFAIQEALADDNTTGAIQAYAQISNDIANVNMALFAGAAHMRWMEISKALSGYAEEGAGAKDIARARDAFIDLSETIINLDESFGHADGLTHYLTFCPMANNNRGAYWLQTHNKIDNSFFGASMLRCGSVKKEFRSQSQ